MVLASSLVKLSLPYRPCSSKSVLPSELNPFHIYLAICLFSSCRSILSFWHRGTLRDAPSHLPLAPMYTGSSSAWLEQSEGAVENSKDLS